MSLALSNLTPFTTENSVEARSKSLAVRRSKPKTPSKRQALDLQHALHAAGLELGKDVKACEDKEERARIACALASVAKGWQSMTDQIRILSGKAAPGTLSPAERRAKALERKQPVRSTQPKLVTTADPSVVQESKESISQG